MSCLQRGHAASERPEEHRGLPLRLQHAAADDVPVSVQAPGRHLRQQQHLIMQQVEVLWRRCRKTAAQNDEENVISIYSISPPF